MSSASSHDAPPQLSVIIPKLRDLPEVSKDWDTDVELPTEVLLVTVKDWEFLGCFLYLKNQFYSHHRGLGRVYFGEMGDEKVRVSLLKCSEGAAGPGAALSKVISAITILRPKVVFCVGYCGGLSKEKAKLGDVVISRKLTTYDHKKVMDGREEARGTSATPVSALVAGLIKYADYGWKAPLDDPGSRDVKLHKDGELLSGPELVNSVRRRDELLKKHPRALAIEMEGQGVFAAAHDLKMEWVVIKGISDYADGTKSNTEAWQPFASVMAASVVANVLKGRGILRDWEHYKGVTQKGFNKPIISFGLIAVLVLLAGMAFAWSNSQTNRKEHADRGLGGFQSTPNKVVAEDPMATLLQTITGGSPGQVNFKGRTIGYRAQGRVHSFEEPWVFDGIAWDVESGIKAKVNHFDESEDAIQAAVKEVIKQLKTQGLIQD